MLNIQKNISLKKYNTFQVEAKTKFFIEIESTEELQELIKSKIFLNNKKYILGGGSNTLFTKDFDGLVIKVNILGIALAPNENNDILVQAGAGEDWDNFIQYCLQYNYGGAENLISIPGKVGSVPVQNIGAYGVEAKDIVHSMIGLNLETNTIQTLTKSNCKFGYRNSIFKNELKGKFIITNVVFKLKKVDEDYKFNMDYKDILNSKYVKEGNKITIQKLAEIISDIRESKLPNREKLGTAGSFFKNPILDSEHFNKIKSQYLEIKGYKLEDGLYKLSAGQLIDLCGFKGKTIGNVGTYEKHALVIINKGGATGQEIVDFMQTIQTAVKKNFDIELQPEVIIL